MKAVLISINPKWCEKIVSGEKTIEVRKTRPNIVTPFKCFIYCTKGIIKIQGFTASCQYKIGKVTGEFICNKILARPENTIYYGDAQAEYLDLLNFTCLTESEVIKYMGDNLDKPIYFWHISDLKIYDQPKELGEFGLTRPPQSWCYVEELC